MLGRGCGLRAPSFFQFALQPNPAVRITRCNQLGLSLDGAPAGVPTIASRLVIPAYYEVRPSSLRQRALLPRFLQRQCTYYFPKTFPQPRQPDISSTNVVYGGWNLTANHLFLANGQRTSSHLRLTVAQFSRITNRRPLARRYRVRRRLDRRQYCQPANRC